MYSLREAATYDEIAQGFRWIMPDRYNTAVDACDRHAASGGRALLYVNQEGEEQELTFRQMKRLSDSLAACLTKKGIGPWDRIVVMLPQRPESAAAHLAALKIGCIGVPLSLLYGRESLLTRLVDCEPKVIVTTTSQADRILEQISRIPSLSMLVLVDGVKQRTRNLQRDGVEVCDWDSCTESSTKTLKGVRSKPDDPALLIYTAGTSGAPKGVLLPHRAVLSRIVAIQLAHYPFPAPGDLYWSPVDWSWVGGLVNSLLVPWILGVPVFSYERGEKFAPEKALEMMETYGVRNCFVPPFALNIFKKRLSEIGAKYKLDIRSMHSGGESLPPELFQWATKEFKVTVNEVYGITEAGIVAGNCAPLLPVKPGSMGKAIPGHEVTVLDEAGQEASAGVNGLVAVRRDLPSMFLGYWRDEELTQSFFRESWFIPGDVASRNGGGYFWFAGRRDVVVKTSGYRVSPLEVEYLLSNHRAISRCVVVAVPDEERGSILKAYVQLKKGLAPSPALATDIQEYAKKTAGLHQYPRRIEFVDQLPDIPLREKRRKEVV